MTSHLFTKHPMITSIEVFVNLSQSIPLARKSKEVRGNGNRNGRGQGSKEKRRIDSFQDTPLSGQLTEFFPLKSDDSQPFKGIE